MVGNWSLARRQEHLLNQRELAAAQRELMLEQRRVAGRIADHLLVALRALRGLDEQYFQELVSDVFLPRDWYEKYEPVLLREIGDVVDTDARRALTDIVTLLGQSRLLPNRSAAYHYVESQILLGLEVAHALGRSERLSDAVRGGVTELRTRRDKADRDS